MRINCNKISIPLQSNGSHIKRMLRGVYEIVMMLVFPGIQGESEGCANIGLTAHVNTVSVCFNDMFTNGEAESAATFFSAPGGICAIK